MREGMRADQIEIERYVDVKYFSQSRFFTVAIKDERITNLEGITRDFMAAMQAAYGYTLPPGYAPVELVNLRVIAIGQIPKPHLPEITRPASLADAHKGRRSVWFRGSGFVEAAIYERGKLPAGISFAGPAIVEQPDTTTVMPPGTLCTPDKYGNLVIKVER
jgi:N-methylhydantoinase A